MAPQNGLRTKETMDTALGKTLGDYYRDLAANYFYYSLDRDHPNWLPWPDRPIGWYDPLQGSSLDDLSF